MSALLACLCACLQVGQPTETKPPGAIPAVQETGDLASRLKAIDDAVAKVQDLCADFEQKKHTAVLKKPLVSRGVVRCKGELARWDTASPRASTLLIGRADIRMYYPDDKLVEIFPVGEGFKDLAGAPLPRLSTLKDQFEISRIDPQGIDPGGTTTSFLALQLVPRNEGLRRHITSVRILIDESRPAATKVVMTDPDGDITEITFSNIKLNTGIREQDVVLQLPAGVRESRPLGDAR